MIHHKWTVKSELSPAAHQEHFVSNPLEFAMLRETEGDGRARKQTLVISHCSGLSKWIKGQNTKSSRVRTHEQPWGKKAGMWREIQQRCHPPATLSVLDSMRWSEIIGLVLFLVLLNEKWKFQGTTHWLARHLSAGQKVETWEKNTTSERHIHSKMTKMTFFLLP